MLHSHLEEIIKELLLKEEGAVDISANNDIERKIRELERELDDSLVHAFDKLKEKLRELNNDFSLGLEESDMDRITLKVKEKIQRNQ